MLNSLAYLEKRGYLRPSDQFHQAYEEVEQKAHQVHLMMLELRALVQVKRAWGVDRILKIITLLARLIHEFAKNFHNFIFYNQLCNLDQKSLFRWNNWQVQYLRQFLRFYEFFGLGKTW